MEHNGEIERLETKTDENTISRLATWAGLKPGMEVADVGCGIGKTTAVLQALVGANGRAVGIDASEKRIEYAREKYPQPDYCIADVCDHVDTIGQFDFIWSRFLLEYHKSRAFTIVQNLHGMLKPGGILCLGDLDYNCMTHYDLEQDLQAALFGSIRYLEEYMDFDPYAGRKLYSYLYDLEYEDIHISMEPHHLFYGEISKTDEHNWTKKIDVALSKINYSFPELKGGFEEFRKRMLAFMQDPRRFTYTPIIFCRGVKPERT